MADWTELRADVSLQSEANLAVRIKIERAARGWTPARLAQAMTDAGCPINQSAIWKIENGTPRRKITVDELIAMATVFEKRIEDLLAPVGDEVVIEALRALRRAHSTGPNAVAELTYMAHQLHRVLQFVDLADELDADKTVHLSESEQEEFEAWIGQLVELVHQAHTLTARLIDLVDLASAMEITKRGWMISKEELRRGEHQEAR